MQDNDRIIMILVIVVILIWITVAFVKWLTAPRKTMLPFMHNDYTASGEAVALLKTQGYKVVHGKHKVSINMVVDDDEEELHSQLFINYFASKGNQLFLVKLLRKRQPIRWTGSAVRDEFLSYYLLYDDIDGILYLDLERGMVKKIVFSIDYLE